MQTLVPLALGIAAQLATALTLATLLTVWRSLFNAISGKQVFHADTPPSFVARGILAPLCGGIVAGVLSHEEAVHNAIILGAISSGLALFLSILGAVPGLRTPKERNLALKIVEILFMLLSTVAGGYLAAGTQPYTQDESSTERIFRLLLFVVIVVAVLLVVFIPTIIAKKRNHPHFAFIAGVNVATSWTLIGWVVCLAWALWKPQRVVTPAELESSERSDLGETSKLKELTRMYADQLISKEEFNAKRAAILSRL